MTKDQSNRIIAILHNAKGDDLYRAERQFANYTQKQMQGTWGESGKSCQEILDEYKDQENSINELIEAVKRSAD